MTTRTAPAAFAAAVIVPALAHASEIVPLERDSIVKLTMSNLDFTPGSTSTGGPVEVSETGLTSSDDILLTGQLYYGPDGFDRINTGTYYGLQDLTVTAGSLSADLTQSASVTGEANPLAAINNDICFWFTVDADCEGEIAFDFDGATNSGVDAVGVELRRVDENDNSLETVFQLAATGLDGSGSGSQPTSFIAGERYKLTSWGDARSLVDTGAVQSHMRTTITLDAGPCNAADLVEPFGLLDLADINAFASAFLAQEDAADIVDDGLWDLADINAFVTAFNAGCP